MLRFSIEARANVSNAATLLVCASAPPVLWFVCRESPLPMMVGSLAWGAALAMKIGVNRTPAVMRLTRRGTKGAALAGLISGVMELGAIWLAVLVGMIGATLENGLWCGVGAAVTEVAYLVVLGVMRRDDPELRRQHRIWLRGAAASHLVTHMFAVERSLAGMVHIGTRMLVMASVATGQFAPAAFALVTFVAVDGTATYGAVRRWNWCRPRTARRFYLFLAICAAAVCAGAAWIASAQGAFSPAAPA